jgi:hypothetical protein
VKYYFAVRRVDRTRNLGRFVLVCHPVGAHTNYPDFLSSLLGGASEIDEAHANLSIKVATYCPKLSRAIMC